MPAAPLVDHYIVCGANSLAHRLVVELTEQYDVPVVAIVPDRDRDHAPQIAKILGDSAVVASASIGEEALHLADAATARGITFVDGDDQSNIHAALRVQALNPEIRIVLRMYNQRLGEQIEKLFADCSALSRSATAAPAFVDAALRRPNSVMVGGRAVTIAQRGAIEPINFLCTVADRIDQQDLSMMRLLPDAPGPTAQWLDEVARKQRPIEGYRAVLQFLEGEPNQSLTRLARLRWRLIDMRRFFTSAQLRIVLTASMAVLFASFILIWILSRPVGWAVYETLLDLAGSAVPDNYAQPSGTGGAWQRVAQVAITLCGIPLMAVVTAILVENTGQARRNAPKLPSAGVRGHVVVVGLGNVGARIATLLNDVDVPVVCIERDPGARGISVARSLDIPVLVGEAPLESQLRQAHVATSRAVVAVTGDDATNLEAVLEARAIRPDVRVVLRLFDDDFATHVYRTFANAASRSVSYLAAPKFAAALMGREVVGTLSVYRHVILVAEFTVEQDSPPAAETLRDVEAPGEVRIIAVKSPGAADYLWRPDRGRRLAAGDRYVIIATRAGFARHSARTSNSAHGHADWYGNGARRAPTHREPPTGSDEVPIAVYLSDAASGEAVRKAVKAYLRAIGAQIVEDNEPVIGSWSWFAKATRLGKTAAGSQAGRSAGALAESAAWGPVRSRQADINFVNSQAVANLVQSLAACDTGVIQVGSLLVVKYNNIPIVVMLSQRQVNELEQRPALLAEPETILEHLQRVRAQEAAEPDPPAIFT